MMAAGLFDKRGDKGCHGDNAHLALVSTNPFNEGQTVETGHLEFSHHHIKGGLYEQL